MKRLLILLLFSLGQSWATTYYVGLTGSDSNSTVQAQNPATPWLSIQHAADTVSAGDIVLVEDGTYTAATQSPACTGGQNTGKGMVSPSRSGSSSAYITFKSQHKWGAVLDGQGGPWNVGCAEGWRISGSYITIQDFEMKGFLDDVIDNYQGGTYLNIVGNYIHHIGRYCCATGTGRDAMIFYHGPVTVEQNIIADIGKYDPGENGCVSAGSAPPPIPPNPETGTDWFWQQNDQGLYLAGTLTIMIRNNIFYRIEHGYPVQVYPYGGTVTLSVLNNTFDYCNSHTGYNFCIIIDGATANMRIMNNIVQEPTDSLAYFATGANAPCYVQNNILSNNASFIIGSNACTTSGNLLNTSPRLTTVGVQTMDATPLTPDAHLLSGSPAIGAGLTLADVTNDFAGNPRTTPPSIGALEYVSGNPQASTPTFSPVAGTYPSTQSVTISCSTGPTACYNTTGSPATNGTTGCTIGSLVSGPVAVNVSESLYAVCGGTGYTDSAVASAAYIIGGASYSKSPSQTLSTTAVVVATQSRHITQTETLATSDTLAYAHTMNVSVPLSETLSTVSIVGYTQSLKKPLTETLTTSATPAYIRNTTVSRACGENLSTQDLSSNALISPGKVIKSRCYGFVSSNRGQVEFQYTQDQTVITAVRPSGLPFGLENGLGQLLLENGLGFLALEP